VLFNSYPFIFAFLPATLLAFFVVARWSRRGAAAVLALASLFFYGWWEVRYVLLLVGSIAFNYASGFAIGRCAATGHPRAANAVTAFAIAANLAALGYFKYAGFAITNFDAITGAAETIPRIVLPLGISFFTFTQIAFLADTRGGIAREYNPIHYALFVTYFPHLIAGPILHHKEMMPQFEGAAAYSPRASNFAVGLTIFAIGLAKKTVLADGIAPYANDVFGAAGHGGAPTLIVAWGGVIAYALQLYFDFSGYSDMAIGLSRLFGIRLPLNFDSPYKAASITDFWRRWHMTLSRFLRDYLYFPLGGNRKGPVRRYVNLMVVMLLGGLWHGAGWTFVLWGALHGAYLVVNHAWVAVHQALGIRGGGRLGHAAGVAITFVAVLFAWTLFRAPSLPVAVTMLAGMVGLHGISLPAALAPAFGPIASTLAAHGVAFTLGGGAQFVSTWAWIVVLLPIVFLAPNTQEIMARFEPALGFRGERLPVRLLWRPTRNWAFASGVLAAVGVLALTHHSEFIYFQF